MATMPNNPYAFPTFNQEGISVSPYTQNTWATGMNVMPAGSSMQGFTPNYSLTSSADVARRSYSDGLRMPQNNQLTLWGNTPSNNDPAFWANPGDALKGVGSVLTGVGSLAQAWTAMKGLDLARESAANQQMQWNKNYDAQRTATNNAIANQNAWKAASGRSDLGSYVGDWSGAANLQPANRTA